MKVGGDGVRKLQAPGWRKPSVTEIYIANVKNDIHQHLKVKTVNENFFNFFLLLLKGEANLQ